MLTTAYQIFLRYYPLLFHGMLITLLVSLSGTFFGLILGLGLSSLRNLRDKEHAPVGIRLIKAMLRTIATAYIEFVRGTPMIVQAVFVYYAIYQVFKWTPVVAGVVIVSFNTAAYMSEIIRSGIQSIDEGQREAALSIGMSEAMCFRLIILPQAIRNAFPAIGNEFIVNIKDISVLNVIALTELFFMGMSVAGTTYKFPETMLILLITYFILTFSVTQILHAIEHRMNMPKSQIQSVSVSHV